MSETVHRGMPRRVFLGTIALGAGALALSGAAAALRRPGGSGDTFRFLLVNDVHVQQERGFTHPTYLRANLRARWLLEHLTDPEVIPPVEFIVLNGDMIHQGTLESNRSAFAHLRTLLPEIPVPYYPVVGNHEVSQREGDPLWEAPYVETYGEARRFYSFVRGGVAFVVFNNAGTGEDRPDEVFRLRRERLAAMLAEHAGTPTIVLCHIPVYPVREETVLADSFGFRSWRVLESEIAGLLENSPSVIAVFSGHLHLTGMARRGAITQCVFSGTASYPHDLGLVTVGPDGLTVEAIRLPAHLHVRETNIHGIPRHTVDYTDRRHGTHEAYLTGTADERRLRVERPG